MNVRACVSCGHVWTTLSPQELRAFITAESDELDRQDLEAIDLGPDHDIPDLPEASQAAAGVAEIDDLFRRGNLPAVRRFRELTHTSWDNAIDAVRKWPKLPRPQKLALFGWQPPPSPKNKDKKSTEPSHPMRDPWLDG